MNMQYLRSVPPYMALFLFIDKNIENVDPDRILLEAEI